MTTLPVDAPAVVSLTHLDEDWAVPCERGARADEAAVTGLAWAQDETNCGGSNAAEWVVWLACGCAPVYVLYCSPCLDFLRAYPRVTCAVCETTFQPSSTAYRLIEPLNRRTT
jgi:hypothetical protein